MKKIALLILSLLLGITSSAMAQDVPFPISLGTVWTPTQWNQAWQQKLDYPATTAIPLFNWTSSARPSSPSPGWIGYNTTLGVMEYWNGSAWTAPGGSGVVGTGAQYSLPYYSNAGTSTTISGLSSLGASGQILTSQGAGNPPHWTNSAACTAGGGFCVGWYNVRSYGAVNNDSSCASTSTTTAAFNSALAAATAAGGGVVYVPAGVYCISAMNALGSNIVLRGDGKQATNIISQSTTGDMISTTGNFNEIQDLMLTAESVRTSGSAINISGNNNLVINVILNADYTSGNGHSWFNGVTVNDASNTLGNTWNITLRDVFGVYVSNVEVNLGWAFAITLDNVQFGSPPTLLATYAVAISHSNTVVVMNCGFAGEKGGMLVSAVAGDTIYAIFLTDVFFDAITTNPAVQLVAAAGGTYATSGSIYEFRADKVWASNGTSNNGFEINGGIVGGKQLVSDVKFVNSIARSGGSGSAGTGFLVSGAQDVTVVGSTFSGFGQGMAVGAGTNDVSFIGNSAGAYGNPGPTGYPGGTLPNATGIVVGGTTDYVVVTDNRLDGNTTAALTNSSAGAHVIICNNAGSSVTLNCGGGGGSGTVNSGTAGQIAVYPSSGNAVSGSSNPTATTLTLSGSSNIALNLTNGFGIYCSTGCGSQPQNEIFGDSTGQTWLGSPTSSGGSNVVIQNNLVPSAANSLNIGSATDFWQQAYVNIATINSSATIAGNTVPSITGTITASRCLQYSGTAGLITAASATCGTITGITTSGNLSGSGTSGSVALSMSTTPSFTSVGTNTYNNASGTQILGYYSGSNTTFIGTGGNIGMEGVTVPNSTNTYTLGNASFYWSGVYSTQYFVGTGSTAGVSCSGTPSASFASVNGIVTHC